MSAKAGDIVFDITGDDSKLRQTLTGAKGHAMKAGQAIGAAMTAAGAVITGFAISSVRDFAAAGDELHKMSLRTGISVEALSELKHAAEQSGSSLASIGKASKNLSKIFSEAMNEYLAGYEKAEKAQEVINGAMFAGDMISGSYSDALRAIGLSFERLDGMTPEEMFYKVVYALSDVQDAALQSAYAQELFGRAGVDLLPMIQSGREGIKAYADEAHRLGINFNDVGAKKAYDFVDGLDKLQKSFQSFKYDIAEALIPTLIELMQWITDTMVAFREWRDENGPLADSIIKMTTAAGGIMVVLGPLLVMLPGIAVAVKAIAAAFIFVAGTIGAPVSVVVAAVALLSAAAYGVYKEWDWVKGLLIGIWESLASAFETLFSPIFWAWEKLQGMALDAKIQVQQARQAQGQASAATMPGGGQAAAATQAPMGGGGFLGLGSGGITINVNGAGDPGAVSRMVADALRGELRARGFAT